MLDRKIEKLIGLQSRSNDIILYYSFFAEENSEEKDMGVCKEGRVRRRWGGIGSGKRWEARMKRHIVGGRKMREAVGTH